jgi:hypothetical protein
VQIINNEKLIVRTRHPSRITQAIQNSKPIGKKDDVTSIEVAWGLEEAISLRKLNIKNVPSPILKDYDWPGLYALWRIKEKHHRFYQLTDELFASTSRYRQDSVWYMGF